MFQIRPRIKEEPPICIQGSQCFALKAKAGKTHYDNKVKESALNIGDRVLVRNDGVRGKCKLADNWEEIPHTIISQPNTDIPVFIVKPEI